MQQQGEGHRASLMLVSVEGRNSIKPEMAQACFAEKATGESLLRPHAQATKSQVVHTASVLPPSRVLLPRPRRAHPFIYISAKIHSGPKVIKTHMGLRHRGDTQWGKKLL